MTIRSYFYDSVDNDLTYAATDFANAFSVITETGILPKNEAGQLGFDCGGTNYTTIYAGKAVVLGRFVEVIGTEILTVPAGTYSGQIVLKVDADIGRKATVIVKTNRTPVKTSSLYELPLYDAAISNGVITGIYDVRTQGGAVANVYKKGEIDTKLSTKVSFYESTNGEYLLRNASTYFYGTWSPNANYLISVRDSAHAGKFLILLSHYQDQEYNAVTQLAGSDLSYIPNAYGTIGINNLSGEARITVVALGRG